MPSPDMSRDKEMHGARRGQKDYVHRSTDRPQGYTNQFLLGLALYFHRRSCPSNRNSHQKVFVWRTGLRVWAGVVCKRGNSWERLWLCGAALHEESLIDAPNSSRGRSSGPSVESGKVGWGVGAFNSSVAGLAGLKMRAGSLGERKSGLGGAMEGCSPRG